MLKLYRQGHGRAMEWREGQPLPQGSQWLDLFDPTEAERAAVEALIDAPLPQREAINALGISTRHHEQRVLSLHARLYADHDHQKSTPLGMMVMSDCLVTLRYSASRAIDQAVECLETGKGGIGGPAAFTLLLDAISNDVAEQMQKIAVDVAQLSDDVFNGLRERTSELRDKLLRVGKIEGRLARYRTSLLGIGRVAGFVSRRAPDWFGDDAAAEARVIVNDLKTLNEFEDQLTEKLAFLQDAVLGFINTDQNAVMKLLTVASVVTIPPVILAGIWGMNFKHMPELNKPWGYAMALSALLVSMVVPLLIFASRGWLSRD